MRRSHQVFLGVLAAVACLVAASCGHRPVKSEAVPPALEPVPWRSLGAFEDDLAFEGLAQACRASLAYFQKIPPGTPFGFGRRKATAKDLADTASSLLAILGDDRLGPRKKLEQIQRGFGLFTSTGSDGAGAVLVTGYYEPWLEGRRTPDERFKVPVYHRPEDLLTVDLGLFPAAGSQAKLGARVKGNQVVPYYTRGEIAGGALAGKGLELLWLEDPVDLFFLQVQGSGKVTLEDGSQVRLQYDAQNGQPYRSLGKALIEKGILAPGEVSLQSIRQFFKDHPDQLSLLDVNPSYTFFRMEKEGPFGNIGVVLTPGRSIATDARVFPKGAPALLRSRKPVVNGKGEVTGWVPFTRFVFNQDTGGAITGPGRVDLFWGGGPLAEAAAGRMKEPGELYFLLKR